ncbi:hypothetical protein HKX48_009443 [Thoreauomyces humboldtii]|nr:hypothetical protein HKX48_009443 [Thoreauomyces humboldtii]
MTGDTSSSKDKLGPNNNGGKPSSSSTDPVTQSHSIYRTAELEPDELHHAPHRGSHERLAGFDGRPMSTGEMDGDGKRGGWFGSGMPMISRPEVNRGTPLSRAVDPDGEVAAVTVPAGGGDPIRSSSRSDTITDAMFAVLLTRTGLVFAAGGYSSTTLWQFLIVFAPLYTSYLYMVLDHDRHFGRRDVGNVVYGGARMAVLFAAAFVVPMVWNTSDSTWQAFAALMCISRGCHLVTHLVVGSSTRARRGWWIVSVRAASLLVPAALWGGSLGLDPQSGLVTRNRMWIVAACLDQLSVVMIGLAESFMGRKAVERDGGAERQTYGRRRTTVTAFVLAIGVLGLFDFRVGVGDPDDHTAVPLYPRSLLAAALGLVAIYALDRIHSRATVDRGSSESSMPPSSVPHVMPHRMLTPVHPGLRFLQSYALVVLLATAIIALSGLQTTQRGLAASVRQETQYDYTPPGNPPLFSAALAAKSFSPMATAYLQDVYSTDLPYAAAVFLTSPVSGGTSSLVDGSEWTGHAVWSVAAGCFCVVTGLVAGMGVRVGGATERPRAGRRRWAWSGMGGRVLIGVAVAIPGLVGAGASVTLISTACVLALGALVAEWASV